MMKSDDRRRLSAIINSLADENMNNFRICSENNLVAADNLRSALTNLNKAYERMQQLIVLIQQQSAIQGKES